LVAHLVGHGVQLARQRAVGRHVAGVGHFVGHRLAARQLDAAHVLALVAQDFAADRVLQGLGGAEHAVVVRPAGALEQRRVVRAQRVGAVALDHQHPVLVAQRHQARGALEGLELVDHQRLAQEGLDQVRLQRGQRVGVQHLDAVARRHAHRGVGLAVGGLARAQAGAVAVALQVELLAGVDQVRVLDVLQVHAPQLGPAPGRAQELARDAPQRVAAAYGVFVGRVGRQRRQRHAGLRRLLRGGALLGGDGRVDAMLRLGQRRGASRATRAPSGASRRPVRT
jgi:hypothetical protein